jgi:hypothetical protein
MRYYFFGDLHGNAYALEKCLSHLDEIGAEQVYCLGDLVGWLPYGDRTLKRMWSHNIPTVAGNHDLLVAGLFTDHPHQLDRMQATAYNAGLLSTISGAVDYLLKLPLAFEEEELTVVHHSPFNLPENGQQPTIHCFDYLDETVLADCLEAWRAYPRRFIFSAHDHLPAVYELPLEVPLPQVKDVIIHRPTEAANLTVRVRPNCHYWIKMGSVGGPYRDHVPLVNSVLYDDVAETVTLFRIPYSKHKLHEELSSHRFARNLATIRDYLRLLS